MPGRCRSAGGARRVARTRRPPPTRLRAPRETTCRAGRDGSRFLLRQPQTFARGFVHPVDQVLPPAKLVTLGLQHVLVMYAGAVAVPLILGRALKLPPEDVAFLISADLFTCGLATLVQCVGFPGVGIRLPVMMGVTFASLGPMLSMAAVPEIGLLGIYGSVIGAGIFAVIVAPFMGRLLPLFPPVVTGTIILVIGVTFRRV